MNIENIKDNLNNKLKFENIDISNKQLVYGCIEIIKEFLIKGFNLKQICQFISVSGYKISYFNLRYHLNTLIEEEEKKRLFRMGKSCAKYKHLYKTEQTSNIRTHENSVNILKPAKQTLTHSKHISINDEEQRIINAAIRDAEFEKSKAIPRFTKEQKEFYDTLISEKDILFFELIIKHKSNMEEVKKVWAKEYKSDFNINPGTKKSIYMFYEEKFKKFINH